MRLLHIDRVFKVCGGMTHIQGLAGINKRYGHWVGVMAAKGPMMERLRPDVDLISTAYMCAAFQRPWLRKFIRKHEIEVVDMHAYSQTRASLPAVQAAGAKAVVTPHGDASPEHLRRRMPQFAAADGIMVVDEQIARLYQKSGVPRKKLFLYRVFIDWPAQPPRTPGPAAVFGYCSRLSGQKGPLCESWLHAVASLPIADKRVIIWGDGSHRAAIERTTKDLGLKADLRGSVPNASLQFSEADIFTGASVVVLEALRAGCACVPIGFDGCLGALTLENLKPAIAVNFGDRLLRPAPKDSAFIAKGLSRAAEIFASGEAQSVADAARAECSSDAIAPRVEGFFQAVREGRDYSDFSIPWDQNANPAACFE